MAGSKQPPPTVVRNTLRLSRLELETLLESLDQASAANDARRAFARLPFRHESITVEVHQPGGTKCSLNLAARNLSRSGVSLLHSSYLHPSTPCAAHLPRANRTAVAVAGTIARCRHVSGTVHEIGIRFKSLIDVSEFLNLDPLAGRFSLEHVDPAALRGVVIYSDPSPLNRKVLQALFNPTQIDLRFASPADPDAAWEGADLVILDADAEADDPGVIAARIRAHAVACPVILATAEPSLVTPEIAAQGRIDAVVRTPLVPEELLRAVAEYLAPRSAPPAEGADQLRTLADSGMRTTLVRDFLADAAKAAPVLETAAKSNNVPVALRLCSHLQGKAEALGCERIATAARAAAGSLRSSMSMTEARPFLEALIHFCRPESKAA